MTKFFLTPGNSLGCKTNAHRHGWEGEVCSDPANWHCDAQQRFREDYCARGSRRCFHLCNFALNAPFMVIEEGGAHWALKDDPDLFNDQVLLLYGPQFAEPRGSKAGKHVVYGAYRIQVVHKVEDHYRTNYRVEPYADGWCRFDEFRIPRPYEDPTGGKYIKQFNRDNVRRIFDEAILRLDDASAEALPKQRAQRLRNFADKLDAWLDVAAERCEERGIPRGQVRAEIQEFGAAPTRDPSMSALAEKLSLRVTKESEARLSTLEDRALATRQATASSAALVGASAHAQASATPSTDAVARDASVLLVDPARDTWICEQYGEHVRTKLRIAESTKSFVILSGNPGVGKSYLATNLIDDPSRERLLIVPVSATWRGREDLLGYVNPVDHGFVPTAFTRFLFRAAAAWKSGDRRSRVVVFEEFNLSQPEHWLADVLAISQFDSENDRYLELGGSGVVGGPAEDRVWLSPAVFFLGTINSDHTTRPLSPRVMDRAARIELRLAPNEAIDAVGVDLDAKQRSAINELDELLVPKGATFSIRTARSIHLCQRRFAASGVATIDTWMVIDLVLAQEVLSKVRLLAGDPTDAALLAALTDWASEHGTQLPTCSGTVEDWKASLEAGIDVVSA